MSGGPEIFTCERLVMLDRPGPKTITDVVSPRWITSPVMNPVPELPTPRNSAFGGDDAGGGTVMSIPVTVALGVVVITEALPGGLPVPPGWLAGEEEDWPPAPPQPVTIMV